MSIRFVTGVPGSGKGMYTMKNIIFELTTTQRPIITNFALRLGPWVRGNGKAEIGLLAYLQKTFGKTFDAEARIHFITDEQCKQFYLYRIRKADGQLFEQNIDDVLAGTVTANGLAYNGKQLFKMRPIYGDTGKSTKGDKIVAFEHEDFAASLPAAYFIDEAWQCFNAHDWQLMDRGVLYYNAQHRKAGDDLWIITQHHSQCVKNLRVLAAEYHECVNHSKRRFGLFRQPGGISVVITNDAPETGSRTVGNTVLVRLDFKGIGACYDTAAGAGLQGAGADIGEKIRGLPFYVLIALVILCGFLIVKGTDWLPHLFIHATTVKVSPRSINSVPQVKQLAPASQRQLAVPTDAMTFDVPKLRGFDSYTKLLGITETDLVVTGWSHSGDKLQVFLSDGRMLPATWVKTISTDFVELVDGRRYLVRTTYTGETREETVSQGGGAVTGVNGGDSAYNNTDFHRAAVYASKQTSQLGTVPYEEQSSVQAVR